jgi:hypothetical protein
LRRQELRTTKASKYIAISSAVIEAVENVWDETFDLLEVQVPWWLASPWDLLNKIESAPEKRLIVKVGVPEDGVLLDDYLDDIDLYLEVVGEPELRFGDTVSLGRLYEKVVNAPLILDSDIIRGLALETTLSGVEFILLYLKTGSVALLEGERLRISIPFVDFSKVVYHTHPHGSCGLSKEDIRSITTFLVNGGIGGGAVTDSCAVYMVRDGFVHENDFIYLKKLKEPLVLGKQVPKLSSVKIEFSTY